MTSAARRLKISVTLPADLVAAVDSEAGLRANGNRSLVMERWLRRASRLRAEQALEEATIDYYESLSQEQRAEDEILSRALSRAAKRLDIDEPPPKRRRCPSSPYRPR